MAERLNNHDVVIGPALRDLASVDTFIMGKQKLGKENKYKCSKWFKQFGSFVEKFVLNEELDKIYSQNDVPKNVVPIR